MLIKRVIVLDITLFRKWQRLFALNGNGRINACAAVNLEAGGKIYLMMDEHKNKKMICGVDCDGSLD